MEILTQLDVYKENQLTMVGTGNLSGADQEHA